MLPKWIILRLEVISVEIQDSRHVITSVDELDKVPCPTAHRQNNRPYIRCAIESQWKRYLENNIEVYITV